MNIYCLSDNTDTLTGLRLAGIDGQILHTADEVISKLKDLLADTDLALILITEKLASHVPEMINDIRLHHQTPLLIEIPDRHGSGRQANFITNYVNEAIGVKL